MLRLEDVSLLYDFEKEETTYALDHIQLEITQGKFYGILGPSGSGKSSLLYVMSGLKKPTSGKIFYQGREMNLMNDKELSSLRNQEFGFIFQKHFLIPYLDIVQNTLVHMNSNKKEDIERAKTLLTRLGLGNKLNKKPYELSGGQCQRVAIARALIHQPKIIFADEITAALDHRNAEEVMNLLQEIRGEATLLFVTHDETMVREADQKISIWDGKLRG